MNESAGRAGSMGAIGLEVLTASRNELYMSFPYLDAALCALEFRDAEGVVSSGMPAPTGTVATDGESLWYQGSWLARRYLRSRQAVNRGYMHVLFHCILRHIWKARGKDPALWDLACDVAVEALLSEQNYACIEEQASPLKSRFIGECCRDMKVITAEGVYLKLERNPPDRNRLQMLSRAFLFDDHGLWTPEEQREQERRQEQDTRWKDIADRTRTSLETMPSDQGAGGDLMHDQIQVAVKDDVDYRNFLRRFAAPHEVMEADTDSFDYIYYTFGLQHYGNMPLIEPPETREEKRIEDLVIAVDTSMSTSGDLVREFLACTYAILRSTETYTRKVNIRIIQCDNRVRSDDAIHDLDDLQDYMASFRLSGGSSTDFRPVFQHVEELQKSGAFHALRGLIYFTDGMGIYPKKRPDYDTAFIMLAEPPPMVHVPAWAIKLVLELPDLRKAREDAETDEPDMIDWDELPRT